MEFQLSYYQILKDDALKVLYSICQQIWKTQQWSPNWKISVFIPIPKKINAKECSSYHTITLISHASKVMLKILQARLQQYVNLDPPDVQAIFKAMVFPIIMYGFESWTIRRTECWRIDAFELWCWRRLLRVPWIARRSNQSILKEINLEYSLEGLMLKLKFQYFAHLMQRVDSLERLWIREGLWARGEGDDREWDGWIASLTQWTWVCVDSGSWWWTGGPGVLQFMGSQRVGHDWVTELNWTEVGHHTFPSKE